MKCERCGREGASMSTIRHTRECATHQRRARYLIQKRELVQGADDRLTWGPWAPWETPRPLMTEEAARKALDALRYVAGAQFRLRFRDKTIETVGDAGEDL